jgi:type IX secretion system PorP/SprF family membrane protein|tara:strand:+ start:236 stop:1306 length:1071 start_codon:yes stop_codon:yes gene_type:complete
VKRIVILFWVVLVFSLGMKAQRELSTSQYMLHPTFLNPAAVVTKSGKSGGFVFQKQWVGFDGAPTTLLLNYNSPLKNQDNTVGGIIINDRVGVHSKYKIMVLYAHKFRIDRTSFFSFGITPGIDLIQSNYSQAKTDFANDPIFSTQNRSLFSLNMGFGAYYYNNKYWFGVSVPELFYNRFTGSGDDTALNFSLEEMTYQCVVGWKTDLSKLITFKPSVLMKYQLESSLQVDLNAMFEYKEEIGVGVSYRSLSSLNFLANYKINRDFKVGYAFSMQIGSELNNYNSGSHELMVVYGVGNNKKANVNLPKRIKKYRKKKLKEIKKVLKQGEKAGKKKEKNKKESELDSGDDTENQPYG